MSWGGNLLLGYGNWALAYDSERLLSGTAPLTDTLKSNRTRFTYGYLLWQLWRRPRNLQDRGCGRHKLAG
jgi:hypothetical protein